MPPSPTPPQPARATPVWLQLLRVLLCLLLVPAALLGVLMATFAMDAGPSLGGQLMQAGAISGIVTPLIAAKLVDPSPRSLVWLLLPLGSVALFAYGMARLAG